MRKTGFISLVAACACALSAVAFSGCGLFDDSDSISGVRERVETLRHETSDEIIDDFKRNDAQAVITLFCPKTQALPDIAGQVQNSLSFMEGAISEYTVSKSTAYEGYSNEGTKVTDYSFSSETFITTDTGRRYGLSLSFNYIAADDSIEGLTSYNIYERDREENRKICRTGYGWQTPCDPEIGILAAGLVKAIGSGDAAALKQMLCLKTQNIADIDGQISAVFEFFDGTPTFTERADGLYNYSQEENDFSCSAIGYSGGGDDAWTSTVIEPVCTDTGKKYKIHFVAFLQSADADKRGVSWFSVEEWHTDGEVQLGEWLHY